MGVDDFGRVSTSRAELKVKSSKLEVHLDELALTAFRIWTLLKACRARKSLVREGLPNSHVSCSTGSPYP